MKLEKINKSRFFNYFHCPSLRAVTSWGTEQEVALGSTRHKRTFSVYMSAPIVKCPVPFSTATMRWYAGSRSAIPVVGP